MNLLQVHLSVWQTVVLYGLWCDMQQYSGGQANKNMFYLQMIRCFVIFLVKSCKGLGQNIV